VARIVEVAGAEHRCGTGDGRRAAFFLVGDRDPGDALPRQCPLREWFGVETRCSFASGVFGTVTNKRVIYQRAKGWFSGGSREDIPLKHVTSVRLGVSRHILSGILLFLVGFLSAFAHDATLSATGGFLTCVAILLLWGSPTVVVNTAGHDKNASRGWPWQRAGATEFVEAVRNQLVSQ